MTIRDIKAGDEIEAGWWPPAMTVREGTDQLDVTSVTFIAGSPECGVTFVAPLTGRVAVCVQASIDQESAGNRGFVSFEVYEGTSAAGTLRQAAREQYGVSSAGNAASEEQCWGSMAMVSNLTAGATHYVRTVHRVDAGNQNDFRFRALVVFPLP